MNPNLKNMMRMQMLSQMMQQQPQQQNGQQSNAGAALNGINGALSNYIRMNAMNKMTNPNVINQNITSALKQNWASEI